jgi:glutathionyl-hydroquinone reductase
MRPPAASSTSANHGARAVSPRRLAERVPTLVRFDAVYYGHFKCNRQRLVDYPNLWWSYAREIYQMPGIAETVDLDHIKTHYYWSHTSINPKRIVPKGPAIDFTLPHDRKSFS